jgi:hypothetical protein
LGLEALWIQLGALRWGQALKVMMASLLGVIVIAGTASAQGLMPYEINTGQLIQAVRSQTRQPHATVILIPWNYSDFHFLRFAFPDQGIYLVQSAANERGEVVQDPVWTARFAAMYGDHYLASAAAVPAELLRRRVLYIGWTILPSLQNLHDMLLFFRFDRASDYLDRHFRNFRNHMTESWLVYDSRFLMRELAQYGRYQVYEVTYRRRLTELQATASSISVSAPGVPLWGMFETSVLNGRKYADPFIDTELVATFFSPSGKTYNFFGFYDGDGNGGQNGNTWKVRFMCTEVGTWSWSAAFTDGTPGSSGSFQCVRSSLPGSLEVDQNNPHWLKKANGGHLLPRWYYMPELLFSKEGMWQQDVENLLVRSGYNMVTVLTTQAEPLVVKGWNRHEYEKPLFYPWIKQNGAVLWNTMNLASWHKLDRVLQYLGERGIYVYFFDGFFPNIPPRFPDNPVKERAYLRYVLARIGVYWNVTHNIAFEFSEFMSVTRLNRIGRYIKEIDPFNLLLTVHDTQNFAGVVQHEDWIDAANLQYDEGRAGTASTANAFVLAHYFGKPVLSTEVVWEGGGKLTGDQVRRGAWGVLLAGSFSLHGEFLPLDLGKGKAHRYLEIMFDFMQRIPYWTMSPHNELVDSGKFCLANPGQEYIIYAESGGIVSVDLSAATGVLSVEWLNPRTGERTAAGVAPGGAHQSFTPPLETGESDWVLHLSILSHPRG